MPLLTLQAFDYPMLLNEAISDMIDSGVQDDNLTLLYEANKDVMMTVKTRRNLGPEFRCRAGGHDGEGAARGDRRHPCAGDDRRHSEHHRGGHVHER
jgi:hypothetical protein